MAMTTSNSMRVKPRLRMRCLASGVWECADVGSREDHGAPSSHFTFPGGRAGGESSRGCRDSYHRSRCSARRYSPGLRPM